MKKLIVGAAALAAVAIPTTTFAVNSVGDDPLDTYEMEIIAIDLQAENMCDAVRDAIYVERLPLDLVVDVAVDSFAEGWGTDFPQDLRLYVAGLVIGCAN